MVARAVDGGEESRYNVGDQVWVKPPGGSCTTKWALGKVTGVTSANNVSVDGMPRHVLDVRRVIDDEDKREVAVLQEDGGPKGLHGIRDLFEEIDDPPDVAVEEGEDEEMPMVEQRPVRNVRPPVWLEGYEWELN